MATYVNTTHLIQNKPQSHSQLGLTFCNSEEGNTSLDSTGSVYNLASNPASSEFDDGYEVPVSVIVKDQIGKLDKVTGHTISKFEENDSEKRDAEKGCHELPPVVTLNEKESTSAVKRKPVPPKRMKKSHLRTETCSLAKSEDIVGSPSVHGQNTKKTLSRQRVIDPIKGGSGTVIVNAREPRKGSRERNIAKQGSKSKTQLVPFTEKKAENSDKDQKSGTVRSNSVVSDKFEDAFEYLPDNWTLARQKSSKDNRTEDHVNASGFGRGDGSDSKKVEQTVPASGGNYEEAWDLNKRLEAQLSSLKLMNENTETADEGSCLDSVRKQQELESKAQQAGKRRGQNHQSSWHGRSQGQLYDDAWDIKSSLSQMLQSSCGAAVVGPGHSATSACSNVSSACSFAGPVDSTDCIQKQEWYHGTLSRMDAERTLRLCKEGSYLVRDSTDRSHYTLSIKSSQQIIHIQMDQNLTLDGCMSYILGRNSRAFPTIPSMIHYYNHHPVPIKGAQHIKLCYSVPRP